MGRAGRGRVLTLEAKGKKSLRDFPLVGRIGEPLRPEAQGRSQVRRCAARNPCSPLVRAGRGFNSRYASVGIQKQSPTGLRQQGFIFESVVEAERQEIAARFPLVSRIEEPVRPEAHGRSQAHCYAVRIPCSPHAPVPDEDSIPCSRQGFKNKAPPACAGGALFLNTGGGGGNRTLVRKHSTDSSTYLALSINLTWTTGMCTLCTGELP